MPPNEHPILRLLLGSARPDVGRLREKTRMGTGWLATNPAGSGDPDCLTTGDLNAYAQEDPLTVVSLSLVMKNN